MILWRKMGCFIVFKIFFSYELCFTKLSNRRKGMSYSVLLFLQLPSLTLTWPRILFCEAQNSVETFIFCNINIFLYFWAWFFAISENVVISLFLSFFVFVPKHMICWTSVRYQRCCVTSAFCRYSRTFNFTVILKLHSS
jgi:hypothetical protein